MSRGLKRALPWRLAYWRRRSPGGLVGCAYLLLPALFFLPLESVPLFQDRVRGVTILTWFFGMGLALGVAGGRGVREEDLVWLVQKGTPVGDVALEDWILDVGLFALASLWWGLAGAAAFRASGAASLSTGVPLFVFALTTCALARTVAGLLSAWGVRRPTDLTAFAAFLSLTAPVLLLRRPPWVRSLAEGLVPPFLEAVDLMNALRGGDLGGSAGALLHLLLFLGGALALKVWGASRWNPRG